MAAARARFGTNLDDVICRPDHGFVMFHHDHSVAGVSERPDDGDQPIDVARMQADTGFIEDEERVDQRGAEAAG